MNPTHQPNVLTSSVQSHQSLGNEQLIIKQQSSREDQPAEESLEEDPLLDWEFQLESSDQGKLKRENVDNSLNNSSSQSKQYINSQSTAEPLPTFEEIQKSVNMLTRLMPQMFTQEVIHVFYLQLFKKLTPNADVAPPATFNLPSSLPNTAISHSTPISQLASATEAKQLVKRQPDVGQSDHVSQESDASGEKTISPAMKEQKQRHIDRQLVEKKIIVNAFCSGLGFKGIQPEIRRESCLVQITEEKYLEVMKSTIMEAYHYVKKLAGRRYKPIVKTRPTDLLRVLNNCKRTLAPFALRQACLKNFDLSVDQALRLLRGIDEGLLKSHVQLNNSQKPPREIRNERYWKQKQKILRKEQSKNGEFKEMKFQLHTRWTNDFEMLLLKMYREGAGFAQIRDRFQQEYPGQSEMFTVVAIRSMFFKIMRMAVRRLTRQVWKSGRKDLPPLVKMQDQLVKNIINCSQCMNLRKLLVDVYQCETACSRQLLGKVICMINLYYENGGGFKKSQNKERDLDI